MRHQPTAEAAMLAYLFWHRPYETTTVKQYEEALLRFQQHLGQQRPPGFGGSASFRVAALPWLDNRPGYEDWCFLFLQLGHVSLDAVDQRLVGRPQIRSTGRLADDPTTLAELADEFGVSRERVRQIEARTFEKVQKAVQNRVAAIETLVQKPIY